MKLIRRLLRLFIILVLFITGISFADKQYLSDRVIGLQINGAASNELLENIEELANSGKFLDANSFCERLIDSGFDAYCTAGYFDSVAENDTVIPAGIYDTVCISLDTTNDEQYSKLVVSEDIGGNFRSADHKLMALLQKAYIVFLSVIGYVEKIVCILGNIL